MLRLVILTLFLFASATGRTANTNEQKELSFTIDKTWDGEDIPENEKVHIVLTRVDKSNDVKVTIDAPFYDDPAPNGQPGQPFWKLWDYEVVQLFFLNDIDQYLEVEIGPHGQHIVLLSNGERNTIRHSLPLDITTTTTTDSRWIGEAIISSDYFPPEVTKFNAYAIHGVGTERQYLALYPTNGTTAEPDLHNLAYFGPINMTAIDFIEKDTELPSVWESAMDRIFNYKITRQWNDFRTVIPPSSISLQGFEGGVEVNFTIPVNKDPYPAEYLTLALENDVGEAMKLQLYVDGAHFIDLLTDRETKINMENLPLDYWAKTGDKEFIQGSAFIPPSYFPPRVTLMNIRVLFGVKSLIAMTLQPVDVLGNVGFKPDLDNIQHFTPIDFNLLVQSNSEYSDLWKRMLNIPFIPDEEDEITTVAPQDDYDATNEEGLESTSGAETIKDETYPKEEEEATVVVFKHKPKQEDDEVYIREQETLISLKEKGTPVKPKEDDAVEQETSVSQKEEGTPDKSKDDDEAEHKTPVSQKEKDVSDKPREDGQVEHETTLSQKEEGTPDKPKEDDQVEHETLISQKEEGTPVKPKESDQVEHETTLSQKEEDTSDKPKEDGEVEHETLKSEREKGTPDKPKESDQVEHETLISQKEKGKPDKPKEESQVEHETLKSENEKGTPDKPKESDQVEHETLISQKEKGKPDKPKEESQVEHETLISQKEKGTLDKPKESDQVEHETLISQKEKGKPDKPKEESQVEQETLISQKEKGTPDKPKESDQVEHETLISQKEKGTPDKPEEGDQLEQETLISEKEDTADKRKDDTQAKDKEESSGTTNLKTEESKAKIADDAKTPGEMENENETITTVKPEEGEVVKDKPLRFLLKRRQNPAEREEHQRRYEESNTDENELPITFEITIQQNDQPKRPTPNLFGNDASVLKKDQNEASEDLSLEETPVIIEETNIVGLLPPPHPICFTEGLVPDAYRCQVFYECVLENGKWEVYRWRCKRGFYYDSDEVACLRGYC